MITARSAAARRRLIALVAAVAVGCPALSACSSGTGQVASSITTAPPASTTAPVTSRPPTRGAVAPIPAKYSNLYSHLSSNLDAYEAAVRAMPAAPSGTRAGVAGAELLPANGNRLKALLTASAMPAVDAWLDRFHAMGIRGVTLGIKLPMLLARFGPDAKAYTRFYATVADHARRRGMTVDVELGALFCGTAYAACASSFTGSYRQFVADTVVQARVVIRQVRPDILDILSEPTTESSLTGVQELKTPTGVGRYVHDVLAGIGRRGGTKVGAGGATWLASAYDAAILHEDVDLLVMHIYPLNPQIAANIVADTALARRAGTPIVADEVGLYKTDTAGSGAATADSVYRLDSFSFFSPLDMRFLAITGQWAKKAGVTYVSPFWAGQFFAYLRWTPALDDASFPALTRAANQAVAKAFRAGELTQYGRRWPAAL